MTSRPAQPTLPRRPLGKTGLELTVLGVGGWLGMLLKPGLERRTFSEPGALWDSLSDDRAANGAHSTPALTLQNGERWGL